MLLMMSREDLRVCLMIGLYIVCRTKVSAYRSSAEAPLWGVIRKLAATAGAQPVDHHPADKRRLVARCSPHWACLFARLSILLARA